MSNTGPNKKVSLRRAVLTTAATIAIPVLIHVGAVSQQPLAAATALSLLLLPFVLADVRHARYGRAGLLLLGTAALWLLLGGMPLLYATPVAIHLALCALFAATLLPGRKPLISAYVELQYDSVSVATYRYTRRITAAWAVFFGLMAAQSLLLALFAPVEVWSLFVNLLNYFLVLAVFVIEYLVRRRVLRDRQHPSFMRFLRALVRTDFRQLLKQTT